MIKKEVYLWIMFIFITLSKLQFKGYLVLITAYLIFILSLIEKDGEEDDE